MIEEEEGPWCYCGHPRSAHLDEHLQPCDAGLCPCTTFDECVEQDIDFDCGCR